MARILRRLLIVSSRTHRAPAQASEAMCTQSVPYLFLYSSEIAVWQHKTKSSRDSPNHQRNLPTHSISHESTHTKNKHRFKCMTHQYRCKNVKRDEDTKDHTIPKAPALPDRPSQPQTTPIHIHRPEQIRVCRAGQEKQYTRQTLRLSFYFPTHPPAPWPYQQEHLLRRSSLGSRLSDSCDSHASACLCVCICVCAFAFVHQLACVYVCVKK